MDKNIRFDSQGYYSYIGVFKDKDYEPFSLIVDSNIAINLEKFYYNPSSLILKNKCYGDKERIKKWLATMEFLIESINKDTFYGCALQECCWDYELKCLNKNQYEKMENALESQYNWTINDILQHAYSVGVKHEFNVVRNKVKRISTLLDQTDCNPEILSSYACVLKIMILQCSIKKRGRVKSYINFMEFMTKELLGVHAIEANIATNYFLGEYKMQEIGDKIFKFGKKTPVLLNAWNTCWDIFYLRLLQLAHFDGKFKVYNPKLVTGDIGIINLARMTSLEFAISNDEGYLPIVSFYNSDIKPEYIDIMKKLEKEMYFDTVNRKCMRDKIKNKEKHVKDIIINLEEELLYLYNQIE
ncbi:TPA: hypothetical protein PTV31_003117 [Clostridium botulinum]|nr:hypothetical protein [Clostridium botulinum]